MTFRKQSIERALTRLALIASGTVLLLACGTFLGYELLTARQRMASDLSTVGRVIAANSAAALAFQNQDDAIDVLSVLAANRHIVAAGLYDQSGSLFARYPMADAGAAVPSPLGRDGYQFSTTHLLPQEAVTNNDQRLGTLVLKSNLDAFLERLWVYASLAAVAIVLSGLIVVPLSDRLQRHVSQPIQALADTAKVVSERRDYSVRAAKFRDDEVGRLVDAFNDMLTQIQAQDDTLKEREAHLRHEVDERARAEAQIRALNASLEQRVHERTLALEQANQELESFSYSVSHDLRAPLRHVQGYVEMLQRATEGQLEGKALRYLNTIGEASVEMGQLIDDLLDFARMGRAEMARSQVDLGALVQSTIQVEERSAHGRDIVWQVAPLPAVVGDAAMIKQVLVNVIGNAVKYTRQRHQARITIGTAGEEHGRVIVFVRDNGTGFDMQYAHKLFGVFQRLHRSEDFEGTGIGLATVRRIIGRHGGRVWAESVVNEGSAFYFTLQPAAMA